MFEVMQIVKMPNETTPYMDVTLMDSESLDNYLVNVDYNIQYWMERGIQFTNYVRRVIPSLEGEVGLE